VPHLIGVETEAVLVEFEGCCLSCGPPALRRRVDGLAVHCAVRTHQSGQNAAGVGIISLERSFLQKRW
jgi:hypothetical protein